MDYKLKSILRSIYFSAKNMDSKDFQEYVLFSDKPVSDGNFKNKLLDTFVSSYGLTVEHSDKIEANVSLHNKAINIPHKDKFYNESAYYQTLMHETAHYVSSLNPSSSYNEMILAKHLYEEHFKKPANTNDLLMRLHTKEAFDKAHPLERRVLLTYFKEELKAEAMAIAMIREAGYKSEKLNRESYSDTASKAKTISGFVGQDFSKEIHDQNTSYSKETQKLFDIMIERYKEVEKKLGNEIGISSIKNIRKDRDRER